jgi:NADPH2:quinone reductase
MAVPTFTGLGALTLMELPEPAPGPGQLLIRTHAAGVGLWDAQSAQGQLIPPDTALPYTPGFEAAGTVETIGPDVSGFRIGDEVYTYAWPGGGYAEYTVAAAAQVARKPRTLSFVEAAGVPVAGVTALRGVFDQLAIRPRETLLVTAAAGGVGSLAVQLASRAGARVIGTASRRNHPYVRDLGAQEVVDYHGADWVSRVRDASGGGVDAVFECAGAATLDACTGAVRDGGRIVYIVPGNPPTPGRGVSVDFYQPATPGEPLARLAEMFDRGELRVEIQEVLPLEQATDALRKVMERHTRGKIVLGVRGDDRPSS